MMRKIHSCIFLLALVFSCFGYGSDSFSFFRPPPDWKCANPKVLAPHVQIGFIGKGKKNFRPSINLATEEINDISLKEYLSAVINLQKKEKSSITDLGSIQTRAGKGQLLEIKARTSLGDIRLLQMILLQEQTAYIMTGTVLEEEYAHSVQDLLECFRSFEITSDLLSPLGDLEKIQKLNNEIDTLLSLANPKSIKTAWKSFQKKVIKDHPQMGGYWHLLLLKDIYGKFPTRIQAILKE